MQTPKTRTGSLEVPQRVSPTTSRTARQLKTPGSESDSVSSPNQASRTPKDSSPKVFDRRSPRSPVAEKKRPSRVSESESQLAQLQEELKRAKEHLSSSEACKRRAQQEAEEAKNQLASMSAKLEESRKQLLELSDSDDSRIQELRKISQDRDRAWQSELEAIQKQHSMDSAALASAMNEIQKLKIQLDRAAESDAAQARHAESAHAEIHSLRIEFTETIALVEKLKSQLSDGKESEARAVEEVGKANMQLEMAKINEETIRSEGLKAMEEYKSLALELEQSRSQVSALEELVNKLQAVLDNSKMSEETSRNIKVALENGVNEDSKELKSELNNMEIEVGQLKSALEMAERRYREEYIGSNLQIRNAFELVERTKSESCQREAELEAMLRVAKADIEELKEKLIDKETKLQSISEENEMLNLKCEKKQSTEREAELRMELEKLETLGMFGDLKAMLLDKETELQNITEENSMLKSEIQSREMERSEVNNEALASAETARAAEQEALAKLGYVTEEADRSSRKAARVTEQLDAAQATNSEMEAELRRLKVQSDQWRKAAEAAAAMLSTGSNGKYVERTASLDYHTLGGKLGSPYSENKDDYSPNKKTGNMLKKIGVLLKKGQK